MIDEESPVGNLIIPPHARPGGLTNVVQRPTLPLWSSNGTKPKAKLASWKEDSIFPTSFGPFSTRIVWSDRMLGGRKVKIATNFLVASKVGCFLWCILCAVTPFGSYLRGWLINER
jgi:hypothetical protein